ncbi:MAG: class I SAM-dependent methyltransferase [Acidobacteria bacterium]|nr:class I SAM-dependent methyltransferase [Acidobacteriota bacterium]
MSPSKPQVSRLEGLRSLYDAPYFHGTNSGYPKEGYGAHPPDWKSWLKRLDTQLCQGDRWLDLGCAYGFLVEKARGQGYRAMGCDISRYALVQSPGLRGFLTEADALALPFRSESLDLVTAFDVLEHLESPRQTIREMHRCLAPAGLAIITTPDPCRFSRVEPTHVYERPPGHWISLFQENGFFCNFGFEGADFNLVLAASKSEQRVEDVHQALFEKNPVQTGKDAALALTVRVREGFHACPEGWILGELNELYLWNPHHSPIAVSLKFSARTTGHSGALLVIADGRVVARHEFLSDTAELTCSQDPIFFSCGGHALQLQPGDGRDAGQITVRGIELQEQGIDSEALTRQLPFDLFERYHTAALLWQGLHRKPETVLDFGGYIGDRGGHWADAFDFGLPAVFTDIRPADSYRYLPPAALQDHQFDMVLALDVLEHVPPQERRSFLERLSLLSRRYLLVAGPFCSGAVESAERHVREALQDAGVDTHRFLSEHSRNGLPSREDLLQWIAEKGYFFFEVEGMSTFMWEVLQKTSLILAHYQQYHTLEQLNRSINREPLWKGDGPPYRRFFLIAKQATRDGLIPALPRDPEPAALLSFLLNQPEMISPIAVRRHQDTLFLLNETQKHVQLLQNQVRLLEQHDQSLARRAQTLEQLLQAERQKPLARIAWQRLRNRWDRKRE